MIKVFIGLLLALSISTITIDDISAEGLLPPALNTGHNLNVDLVPLADTPVGAIPVGEE